MIASTFTCAESLDQFVSFITKDLFHGAHDQLKETSGTKRNPSTNHSTRIIVLAPYCYHCEEKSGGLFLLGQYLHFGSGGVLDTY